MTKNFSKIALVAALLVLVALSFKVQAHEQRPILFSSPKPAYRYPSEIPGGYTVFHTWDGRTIIRPNNYYPYSSSAYCREYQEKTTVGGKKVDSYGTACMQPDGSWQKIN